MSHYRLSRVSAGLPLDAFAFLAADLTPSGGVVELGFRPFTALASGEEPIPLVSLTVDLHDERAVTFYDSRLPGERGLLLQYSFPDLHPEWADHIHEAQQILLIATANDWMSYPTWGEALDASWVGRAGLVVRANQDGAGTRSAQ